MMRFEDEKTSIDDKLQHYRFRPKVTDEYRPDADYMFKNCKPPKQINGNHYEGKIEPIQFIEANDIPFHEANAIKYVFRWKNKNGIEDLEKAKWYIDRLIEINS